jgi:hypothetical protein
MRFRATVELSGKTATGIRVPDEIVSSLGSSRRPAVRVTIHDHTYRSTVAPMGGAFMLPISAEIRERARVAAGEEVEVGLELDTQPRQVTVPSDLAEALRGCADAARFFDGLSYSNQRRLVMSIEGARTEETRRRRVARTVSSLHEGQVQA